ncbi:MAG: hypothetical protein AB9M60_16530 [Leptothrix sp. (in: b-proteobacteria)]
MKRIPLGSNGLCTGIFTALALGLCGGLLLSLALPVQAASQLDFNRWMRSIDQRSVSVQKRIASGEVEAAHADARELEQLYQRMADYFVAAGQAADAVQISVDGRDLAAQAQAALARADGAEAARATRAIALACNDCHDVYKPFK